MAGVTGWQKQQEEEERQRAELLERLRREEEESAARISTTRLAFSFSRSPRGSRIAAPSTSPPPQPAPVPAPGQEHRREEGSAEEGSARTIEAGSSTEAPADAAAEKTEPESGFRERGREQEDFEALWRGAQAAEERRVEARRLHAELLRRVLQAEEFSSRASALRHVAPEQQRLPLAARERYLEEKRAELLPQEASDAAGGGGNGQRRLQGISREAAQELGVPVTPRGTPVAREGDDFDELWRRAQAIERRREEERRAHRLLLERVHSQIALQRPGLRHVSPPAPRPISPQVSPSPSPIPLSLSLSLRIIYWACRTSHPPRTRQTPPRASPSSGYAMLSTAAMQTRPGLIGGAQAAMTPAPPALAVLVHEANRELAVGRSSPHAAPAEPEKLDEQPSVQEAVAVAASDGLARVKVCLFAAIASSSLLAPRLDAPCP
jgi:hypothetical protein